MFDSTDSATGSVRLSWSSTMKGQKKLVQVWMKMNSASMAAAGRAEGSAMLQKVRNMLAPSTRAASMSS